jgi:hypothetical protein
VAITEALSAHVYDPDRHLRDGETEPPIANTEQRLAAPTRREAGIAADAIIQLANLGLHPGPYEPAHDRTHLGHLDKSDAYDPVLRMFATERQSRGSSIEVNL